MAEQDADGHCQEDPEDKEAVEEGEAFEGRDRLGVGGGIWEKVNSCGLWGGWRA